MPVRAKKVCKKPFCNNLHNNKNGYCDEHQIKKEDNYYKENEYSKYYDWKWRKFSKNFLKKHPVCVKCGAKATITDHKIPIQIMIELYGKNVLQEKYYQPLCHKCNTLKGKEDKKVIEEFYKNRIRNV